MDAVVAALTDGASLLDKFTPKPCGGDLPFFRADHGRSDCAPAAEVWREHRTGELRVTGVDCTHDDMTLPSAPGVSTTEHDHP
ncbi:hypothetical protein [Kitasatospora sp. GAS1066B]|uniref:hypothetical protein n=1 Tax=Kitasatospora sp. GAS1066B TaxID=3156271 RepID=UPI003516A002